MSLQLSGADLLDLAIETERRGERFYRAAERAAADPGAKELFRELADQEIAHRRTFERLGGAIVITEIDPSDWDEALAYIRATVDSTFFADDAPIHQVAVGPTVADMLRQAIAFEQQTLLYFSSLRDLVQPANRPLVDQVIAEERSHVRRLAAMLKNQDAS